MAPQDDEKRAHTYGSHRGHGTRSQYSSFSRPPAGADLLIWRRFKIADVDNSEFITIKELQGALINRDQTPFDIDTCKFLLSKFDADENGQIGFEEFSRLFKYIENWRGIFNRFDKDKSGLIDSKELGIALKELKHNVPPSLIEKRYATTDGITFDRFVRACAVVERSSEDFRKWKPDPHGQISVNYEQFMAILLSPT